MLYMIGTGIYDERDISQKAIDALKKAKKSMPNSTHAL